LAGILEISKLRKALVGTFPVVSPAQAPVCLIYDVEFFTREPLSSATILNTRGCPGVVDVGGGVTEAGVTVTVTLCVTVPTELPAASIYVVVAVGKTVMEISGSAGPISGVMLIFVAPVIFQAKVVEPPDVIEVGLAVK